jgi:PST family polysaccharide transporter/teichuronic acid exporter
MAVHEKAIKGVKWTTLNTLTLTVCTLLKISILARLLDKSDFGLMAIITFVMGFVDLFMDMGISVAILHKQKISRSEYSSLYWINIIFSVLVYLVILGITPLISLFYEEESLNILIPLTGISILIVALGRQYKTILQKNLNFKKIAIIEITSAVISLISAVILAWKGFGVLALVYSLLVNYTLVSLSFLLTGFVSHPIRFHFNFKETKGFLKIGIFQVGSQIVNYFTRDLDILLIGKFFGTEILGGYSLAKQLVFRPSQIINPILTQVATPLLAKIQSDLKLLKANYLKLINIVSTVNFVAYLGVFIFAPYLVQVFYGDSYSDIVMIVRILSVYMYIRALGNPVGSLVVATGKTHLEFYWNLSTLFIMPILIFIGAQYSIEWIAICISVGMCLLVVPNWFFLIRNMIPVSLGDFLLSLVPESNYKEICNYLRK